MNAPREIVERKGPFNPGLRDNGVLNFAMKAVRASAVGAAFLGSPSFAAPPVVVSQDFDSNPDEVFFDPALRVSAPSVENGTLRFYGASISSPDRGLYEMNLSGGAAFPIVFPPDTPEYTYLCPLGYSRYIASQAQSYPHELLLSPAGDWSGFTPFSGLQEGDQHVGCDTSPGGADVFSYIKEIPGDDQLILNVNGVASVLAYVPENTGHTDVSFDTNTVFYINQGSIWQFSWIAGEPTLSRQDFLSRSLELVRGGTAPFYLEDSETLYFAGERAADGTLGVFSTPRLQEAAPDTTPPVIGDPDPETDDFVADTCSQKLPTSTYDVDLTLTDESGPVSVVSAVMEAGGGTLVSLNPGTHYTLNDGVLSLSLPIDPSRLGAGVCVVTVVVADEAGNQSSREFSVNVVPSCMVPSEGTTFTDADLPADGKILVDVATQPGALSFEDVTRQYLVQFAEEGAFLTISSDTEGTDGTLTTIFGISEDDLRQRSRRINAIEVRATRGNYTVSTPDGSSIVVLPGETKTFGIGLPLLLDTPDDTETPDTDPEKEDPKGAGCDTSGGTPDGLMAGVTAALMGVLRRRRK